MRISDRFPDDYVGVLLLTKEGSLVVQHRDDKPGILNPDSLSVFGGNVENKETLGEAAAREIKEELGLDITPEKLVPLKTYYQNMEQHGQTVTCHIFALHGIDPNELTVYEGQGYKILTKETDIRSIKAAPIMKEIIIDYFKTV